MKIVRADEAERYENAQTCTAFEYPTNDSKLNIARVEVSGRYPLSGSAVNKEVTELVYVASGEGRVSVNGTVEALSAGDVILIEPGEEIWWEGNLTLIISCSPPWTLEQYKAIES